MGVIKYFISQSMYERMMEMIREGKTCKEIGDEFSIPDYIINNRLGKVLATTEDRIASNLGDIQRAESLLVTGTFPNYRISPLVKKDYRRYRSLLHYYATADLNEGQVHFTKQLLR
jgi:hypothetical protein